MRDDTFYSAWLDRHSVDSSLFYYEITFYYECFLGQ